MTLNAKNPLLWLCLLLFAFRLFYGFSLNFWLDDEMQIYLLGLQFYTTGKWPYFGPDVVHTHHQLPGALQSLLVGGPLYLAPVPEAPFVWLNLLSFAGLLLLGYYLTRRFPDLPRPLLLIWLMTLPWTLNVSTHIYNPSYLLVASCVFFVAFADLVPALRVGIFSPRTSAWAMGLALGWCFQLHLSWPLLLPFAFIGLALGWREKRLGMGGALAFAGGVFVPCLLLLPTALTYGWQTLLAPAAANTGAKLSHLADLPTMLGRFLSFGSYEVPRWITENDAARWQYVRDHLWLLPSGTVILLLGLAQPLLVLYGLYRRGASPALRRLAEFTVLVICVAFLFSPQPPKARNFYILFPFATCICLAGMQFLLASKRALRGAYQLVLLALVFQAMLATAHYHDRGLYLNRRYAQAAIDSKNYHLLGERRVMEHSGDQPVPP